MRVIFKMKKSADVRYVSHLDMLRAMQRVFLRSGLPVAFTQGFHPHQIITFGMPLPVGATSDSEYMDVDFKEGKSAGEIGEAFAAALPRGWTLLGCTEALPAAPSLMAAAEYSDWVLRYPMLTPEEAGARVEAVLNAKSVMVHKESHKGPAKDVEIRDGIESLRWEADGTGSVVYACLAAGSRKNVSPGLLSLALVPEADQRLMDFCRKEVYGLAAGKRVSLLELYGQTL